MAEQGSGAACEHGGHPNPFEGELSVAHCVDTTVNAMEPAASHPVLDLIAAHPQEQQLPPRDDPMLLFRERSHPRVDRGDLCGYLPY
jgi:hypothetical protein